MANQERPRVLIADDREENRYVLARALSATGFQCLEGMTGAQALAVAETQPDLIILDVRLPDMSGYEVCQRLKANPRTASIPVLQISASFVSPEDRVRALEGGADGYLTHPIDRTVLVATVRSLLRMRIAEANARKSATQWQAAFDALAEGLAILDSDNRLVRWNRPFESICSSAFVPSKRGAPWPFLAPLMGQDEVPSLAGTERFVTEFSIGGRSILLSLGLINPESQHSDKILILSDVTDRKLAEYALRTAEKLAATGKLAHSIAHEINNPLEALTNLIFLARTSDDIEFVQELLTKANAEVERVGRITKQTLAFHRDTQLPVSLDVAALLSEVVAMYHSVSLAKQVNLVLDARTGPQVRGYPGQLRQVFSNLLRNAAEAAPRNSNVIVRVRTVERHGIRGVRVTVHDRGPGIPHDIRKRLFDPFFTTKELKGSGLGLWVSQGLVSRHNGTIRFRSSERAAAHGTTFEVFLPEDHLPVSGEAAEPVYVRTAS
ncbi:ATP-binding response regulator [Occallatibacter riparius]|uniref:histidine kinase n=1 Tax=Occallatibacter riparius TaxID=1002689 RepID=A0A9J7BVR8_9BACT|nr:ATP-binding protein [Occallatibacter riparius]UWZ86791.1 ATP-binding protein [Occallatibacter riparius]